MKKIILFIFMMMCTISVFAKDTITVNNNICERITIVVDSVRQTSGKYMKRYYAVWDNTYLYDSNKATYDYFNLCKRLHVHPRYVMIDDKKIIKK